MNAPPGRRSAPGVGTESAPMSCGDNTSIQRSGPRIAGRVVVNARCSRTWSFEDDHRVARAIQELEWAPAGADVVIIVSAKQHPSLALDYLRNHGNHLGSITIECSHSDTVAAWVRGLRDGVAVTSGQF